MTYLIALTKQSSGVSVEDEMEIMVEQQNADTFD
jgi:hypothetical protein